MARHKNDRPVDDHNRLVYESSEVVDEYLGLHGLFPCEQHLFAQYVEPGDAILDLGVGAGRTVPYLSAQAGQYVAVDYSRPMVDACHREHDGLDVRWMDASNLSAFDTASFDVVVFSYNGIDYLHPLEKRERCLIEIRRVIRPDGVLLFSSHNARALVRPRPLSSGGWRSRVKSNAIQVYSTSRLLWRALPSGSLWKGSGYVRDTATAYTHFAATARRTIEDLADAGFMITEVVSSGQPDPLPRWMDPWLYYACRPSKKDA